MKKKILLICIVLLLFFIGKFSFAKGVWKEYKKRHFIIYYKEAPEEFVYAVEEAAEEYYDEISKNLGFVRYKGWTWDERAKIYIYNDADDYKKAATRAPWSHGLAFAKSKTIRTFPAAHGFFDSVLPHELGHIIFREFVGFKAEAPQWFEEGIAMYQEKARRWGAHKAVKEAIDDERFIPLDELTNLKLYRKTDQATINLFYAESASIVNYMINDLGKLKFVRFCRALEKGRPFEWTLESIYPRFNNLKRLNKAWLNYLERK
ncbi:MAG: peptidase MA family metallohydrolase [Candidatus Zapsychrus exili]|nr:peptidase MA family metallohydrolase [Candidatus Zapsychrus exili]